MLVDKLQCIKLPSERRGMDPIFQTQLYQIIISRKVDTVHFVEIPLHDLGLLKCKG